MGYLDELTMAEPKADADNAGEAQEALGGSFVAGGDLPRDFSSSRDQSPPQEGTDDEANDTKRRADHWYPAGP